MYKHFPTKLNVIQFCTIKLSVQHTKITNLKLRVDFQKFKFRNQTFPSKLWLTPPTVEVCPPPKRAAAASSPQICCCNAFFNK